MSMAAQRCSSEAESKILKEHWDNHELLPTAKFKAAFMGIVNQRFSASGESNFDKFAREVRTKRSFKFLDPLDTVGWIATLGTLSRQLDVENLEKHQHLKLIQNLKESLQESFSDQHGFGPSMRSALADIFTSEKLKQDPNLFYVLERIRDLQDSKLKLLGDIKQFFSPKLIKDYLQLGGDDHFGKNKLRIEVDNSNNPPKKPKPAPTAAANDAKPSNIKNVQGEVALKDSAVAHIEKAINNWGNKANCKMCGRLHKGECHFKQLEKSLANWSDQYWHESKIGRAYYQLNYPVAAKNNPGGI